MKHGKRFISLLLSVLMLLSVVPLGAIAATNAVITVQSTYAKSGATVDVAVSIANNPGILGMTLEVEYDESAATLVGVRKGEALGYMTFTVPKNLKSGCNLPWDAEDVAAEDIKDGTIAVLTFELSETAEVDDFVNVSVSYDSGAIIDKNMVALTPETVDGGIQVLDYTPCDLNDDGIINTTDVVLLRRHIAGGYNVTIVENAGDVNADGKLNTTDVVIIRRYIAGGYNVEPKPAPIVCDHELTATEAKDATCTDDGNNAYWQCKLCGDLFDDEDATQTISFEETVIKAKGHTEEIIPAVAPTYDAFGSTEGIICSVCGITLKEPEAIDPLEKNEIYVEYSVRGNRSSDEYLKNAITKLLANGEQIHANESVINTTEKTYALKSIPEDTIPGYEFKGWYDGSGSDAQRITSIPKGSTGYLELFARWELTVYEIQFDSPDVPCESVTYTVNTGRAIDDPAKQFGYTFVGWSNDDGFIVNRIKPGTTGNITLHANWTSDRKKAVSYSNYGDPIIIEDDMNGQFLFVYDIGRIENVPLYSLDNEMGKTKTEGITIKRSYETMSYIDDQYISGVVNSVSNATTKSSGWTLSKEWETIYEEGEEYYDKQVKSEERTDAEGNTVGGKYFVSNSEGGSSYTSQESGGSKNVSAKVTTENSFGINQSYDTSTEKYCDAKLGAEFKHENGVEASFPVEFIQIGAEVNNTLTVNGEIANGRKDNTAYHIDGSVSGYVGTVKEGDASFSYNVVANKESTWNSSNSFEQSYQSSIETSVTNAVAREIAKTTDYNITNALGENTSETYALDETAKKSDEYSHTVKYAKGTQDKVSVEFEATASAYGYYRMVMATTVHVYGIVGYDVKTNSYYVYTYNVMSDDSYLYLDFSKDTVLFDDCENGLVTFEVPYEVNEYIMGLTTQTDGLVFASSNRIDEFNPTESFDGTVVIPQYQSQYNDDRTFSAIKVTEFDADAFSGNEEITAVILPLYVTEIPNNAFEGCTNLKTVVAYGVTKIGDYAFKGCTSLETFMIDNHITSIGKKAFEGVSEIEVMAANASVADAAIDSGAARVTLNLSKMSDAYDNKKIEISDQCEYFALISDGREYTNLQIDSAATEETFISNVKFKDNKDTPVRSSSSNVSLLRVSVQNAPGFALILENENTNLKLYGEIQLKSRGENAVMSKNVVLSKRSNSYEGRISASGNYLVCGEIENEALLSFSNGKVIEIDKDQFNSYLTESIITFNANGGTLAANEATKKVYCGQAIGTLPTPTRTGYSFDGWYNESGDKITENSTLATAENLTVTARWTVLQYKASWANGTGYSIAVTRTSSPNGGAATGNLNSEAAVYYGDVLSISYSASTGYSITGKGQTSITVTGNVTSSQIYATASVNSYKLSIPTGTGYSIVVKRTSSPKANASSGQLNNGATVYYGDVLSVDYSAATGYNLKSKDYTVTVTGNVSVPAPSVELKKYTYTVRYESVNGTLLGSTTITNTHGTKKTLEAPWYQGYDAPSAQTVIWDSPSKIIVFKYSITPAATEQYVAGGNWSNGFASGTGVFYDCYVQWQNRTATSVQVRIKWVNSIKKAWYGNNQYFSANIGGVSTGTVSIASAAKWNSYITDDSATAFSDWITVPVDAKNPFISVNANMWAEDWSGSWSATMTIPTY